MLTADVADLILHSAASCCMLLCDVQYYDKVIDTLMPTFQRAVSLSGKGSQYIVADAEMAGRPWFVA